MSGSNKERLAMEVMFRDSPRLLPVCLILFCETEFSPKQETRHRRRAAAAAVVLGRGRGERGGVVGRTTAWSRRAVRGSSSVDVLVSTCEQRSAALWWRTGVTYVAHVLSKQRESSSVLTQNDDSPQVNEFLESSGGRRAVL